MQIYLRMSDKICTFTTVKQQINDITEVLRGLSAQIESMQQTIDSQHATICQINRISQRQLWRNPWPETSSWEERQRDWRTPQASLQIRGTSEELRQQQHTSIQGIPERGANPSHEILAQAIRQEARRATGTQRWHDWNEWCRGCHRWGTHRTLWRVRGSRWPAVRRNLTIHPDNIADGTQTADNGGETLCHDMPHLWEKGQKPVGTQTLECRCIWRFSQGTCRLSFRRTIPFLQPHRIFFQGNFRTWNQPGLNGQLDQRGQESCRTCHWKDKGIHNAIGGGGFWRNRLLLQQATGLGMDCADGLFYIGLPRQKPQRAGTRRPLRRLARTDDCRDRPPQRILRTALPQPPSVPGPSQEAIHERNQKPTESIRKLKIKLKNSGCFRSDLGADAFMDLHSIVETTKKYGKSPYNAILALF